MRRGRFDQLLDQPPSPQAWAAIRDFFLAWPAGPSLASAIQRAERRLEHWPDDLRVAGSDPLTGQPDGWWQAFLGEARLPAYASLVRALAVDPLVLEAPILVARLRPILPRVTLLISPRTVPPALLDRLRKSMRSLRHVLIVEV